ncbi:hypothetical protein BDK51DRAFT_41843 [Blyttiomyces helicus]|uniref:Uncharacterized protein n=1 Tax=Blyttiomyces helicus TaxID=388810 RepID=A0A4P9WLN9_9FUNG|nr:hypothetical protein BDK51DRAFT_41843 [Blyttiomyces helicus]|eukprot:RKO93949.1 hypothetical protein BDK51DRAFT_41843 [Blyttiomyces helicus]
MLPGQDTDMDRRVATAALDLAEEIHASSVLCPRVVSALLQEYAFATFPFLYPPSALPPAAASGYWSRIAPPHAAPVSYTAAGGGGQAATSAPLSLPRPRTAAAIAAVSPTPRPEMFSPTPYALPTATRSAVPTPAPTSNPPGVARIQEATREKLLARPQRRRRRPRRWSGTNMFAKGRTPLRNFSMGTTTLSWRRWNTLNEQSQAEERREADHQGNRTLSNPRRRKREPAEADSDSYSDKEKAQKKKVAREPAQNVGLAQHDLVVVHLLASASLTSSLHRSPSPSPIVKEPTL